MSLLDIAILEAKNFRNLKLSVRIIGAPYKIKYNILWDEIFSSITMYQNGGTMEFTGLNGFIFERDK